MSNRVIAIGDIHGCLGQFDALLQSIAPTKEDQLILLGDDVDHGPESAGVLKRIISLSTTHDVVALMGNHEQMMLDARTSHEHFSDWLLNGGDATLRSYGGVRGALRDVPLEHWHFLEHKLRPYFETETHIFVHAGAYPDMSLDEQPDYMLRWERFDSILPHESGKTIICGHTPQKSGRPRNRGYAICIDTHACGGGNLTALDVQCGRVWQADAKGRVTRAHITDFGEE